MGLCCVEGCEGSSEGSVYFEFPTSRGLRKRWQEAVRCPPKIPLGSVVCNRHFRTDEYEQIRGKVRLKGKVVPTLLLGKSDNPDLQTLELPPIEVIPNTDHEDTNNRKSLENVQNNSENCQKDTEDCQKDVITCQKDTESCREDAESPQKDAETCQKDMDTCQKELQNETDLNSVNNDENIEKDTEIIPEVLQKDAREEKQVKDKRRKDRKENGIDKDGVYTENIICRVINNENSKDSKKISDSDPKDIEEMITNYQIKNKLPNPALLPDPRIEPALPMDSIDVENVKDPVFIEVNVDNANGPSGGNEDCLMLLESVQVDIDPASLMLPELDSDVESVHSVEPVERKVDPISLLTSSDEDDVILEEPHIDTVEVSDATDEDDVPLVKLVKKPKKKSLKSLKKRSSKKKLKKSESVNFNPEVMFGMYEFYCVQCRFTTSNTFEYNKHINEHSKVLQVCHICNYTTASRSQFSRHSRKHKDEKKFSCHLCEYKARHKMSLVYHLESHDGKSVKSVKSVNVRDSENESINKSIETVIIDCDSAVKSVWKPKKCKKCAMALARCVCKTKTKSLYSCCDCSYKTKRRSDLKRHRLRQHIDSDGS